MSYVPTIPIKDLTEVKFADLGYTMFADLKEKLERACKDGNVNQNKHAITFVTDNGWMKVYSTIWMVGKKYVLLKENLFIPIDSIVDVV